jgi:hypothetical protein
MFLGTEEFKKPDEFLLFFYSDSISICTCLLEKVLYLESISINTVRFIISMKIMTIPYRFFSLISSN